MSLAEQYPVGSVVWYECDPKRYPWWPCEVSLKQLSLKLLTSWHARLPKAYCSILMQVVSPSEIGVEEEEEEGEGEITLKSFQDNLL